MGAQTEVEELLSEDNMGTLFEDITSARIDFDGLEDELNLFHEHEIIASVVRRSGEPSTAQLKSHAAEVDSQMRSAEVECITHYIQESDNLVDLHAQIAEADQTLQGMEDLLLNFQADLGTISAEIKTLQEQSLSMSIRLRNRKAVEKTLGTFLESLTIAPNLIDGIYESDISEEYLGYLTALDGKLEFIDSDDKATTSKAATEVKPELEKLRVKAVSKVTAIAYGNFTAEDVKERLFVLYVQIRDFLMGKIASLRKPKTNIQMIQQSVLLKFRPLVVFLKEHGSEILPELRTSYTDTMSRILANHFRAYSSTVSKFQEELVGKNDLIGTEESKGLTLFRSGKQKSSAFSLGERSIALTDMIQESKAIVPHEAEGNKTKYPVEAIFRSVLKLLMDTSTSEYLFCFEFFGEFEVFKDVIKGAVGVVEEHWKGVVNQCHDAIGLLLMIRITYQAQVLMAKRRVPGLDAFLDQTSMLLWPRFTAVAEAHLASIKNANLKGLMNDVKGKGGHSAHFITRRYAELIASFCALNADYGDGQLRGLLERMRSSFHDLLLRLSGAHQSPINKSVFLINNYDVILQVVRGALNTSERDSSMGNSSSNIQNNDGGMDGSSIDFFEQQMAHTTSMYVEEELLSKFKDLITWVKRSGDYEGDKHQMLKDFSARWKKVLGEIKDDCMNLFSNLVTGQAILQASMTQLLLYYTRFVETFKDSLPGDAPSINALMYEIKQYSKSF